jgi:hypothetical protein
MKKYFYEKSNIRDWPTNITYGELMTYNSDQVYEWLEDLRTRVLKDWDENGQPPLVGKDEGEIIRSFSRLRQLDAGSLYHTLITPNDPSVVGVVANFTKNATACNQFFPTMLKTKISAGISSDNALSIYDHFTDKLKDKFHHTMKRTLYNDSMYSYSKSILFVREKHYTISFLHTKMVMVDLMGKDYVYLKYPVRWTNTIVNIQSTLQLRQTKYASFLKKG